ncbi:DUF6207 family protein [Streptomyces sp. NBC_00289]|uniref:DUF6207 family protein n=1 Tax=Streptomyces sp. NBC_00289 TaxID=2975703 RepID=UPI0032458EAA
MPPHLTGPSGPICPSRPHTAGRSGPGRRTSRRAGTAGLAWDPINEVHVQQPGLAVVEIAADDEQTRFAIQELLATRWATATDRTTRDPGQPGVWLRCYLYTRSSTPSTGQHEAGEVLKPRSPRAAAGRHSRSRNLRVLPSDQRPQPTAHTRVWLRPGSPAGATREERGRDVRSPTRRKALQGFSRTMVLAGER